MEIDYQAIGQRIKIARIKKGMTQEVVSYIVDVTPAHMSNIETGRKPAPARENLDKLTLELHLSKEEQELLLDLAARPETMRVSADLPEYIMERDIVRAALRTAKEVDATDEEWQEFIDRITKRTPSSRRDGP